jgi:hypothetical protein
VSTTYGQGHAQAMEDNCGNSLVLRCSASENGGTSRFASRLVGEPEIVRLANSVSKSTGGGFMGTERDTRDESEHHATEFSVVARERWTDGGVVEDHAARQLNDVAEWGDYTVFK